MQSGGPMLSPKEQREQFMAFTKTPEWADYQRAKRTHSRQRIRTAAEKVPLWMQTYTPVSSDYVEDYNPLENRRTFQIGGAMMQDREMYLTDDEINQIIQAGGQVEFLD